MSALNSYVNNSGERRILTQSVSLFKELQWTIGPPSWAQPVTLKDDYNGNVNLFKHFNMKLLFSTVFPLVFPCMESDAIFELVWEPGFFRFAF